MARRSIIPPRGRLLWLGLVLLAIVSKELAQFARGLHFEASWLHLLRDTWPNFAGVICAVAGGMLFRPGVDRDRWYLGSVATGTAVLLGWELTQPFTALVFDPLDLIASLAAATVALTAWLVRNVAPPRRRRKAAARPVVYQPSRA